MIWKSRIEPILQKEVFNFLNGEGNLFVRILEEIKKSVVVDYHKTNLQNIIEILFTLLKNKEAHTLLIDFFNTLKKAIDSYEEATWGSKTIKLSTWSPIILSKGKELIEKIDLFRLLPEKDKNSLRKDINDSIDKFYKKTNNKEATNFIRETFKLFTDMKISNFLNWKEKFFPESGSFSLLENILQIFS